MACGGRILDRDQVLLRVPHGPRALLLEQATLEDAVRAVSSVSFSGMESYFAGHYDFAPLLPGYILLELFGQLGAVLWSSLEEHRTRIGVLASVEQMRFRTPIRPPATLELEARVSDSRGAVVWFSCSACLDGRDVARARLAVAGVERLT